MRDDTCHRPDDDDKHLFVGGPLNFSWHTKKAYGCMVSHWQRYQPRTIKLPVSIDPDKFEEFAKVERIVYVWDGQQVSYPILQLVLDALNRGPARV